MLSAVGLSMSRWYGLPSVSACISTDAKSVGYQAGAEGMMTAMAAVLGGAHALVAAGLIDSVRVASIAKLLLDCDSIAALRRLLELPAVDDASTLVDDIEAVGPGGNFLTRRSSRERLRSGEVWHPAVFQRGTMSQFVDRPLVDDALARARELLAAYTPTPLPVDVHREARGIFDRHARAVG